MTEAFPIASQESIQKLIRVKDNVKLEMKAIDIRNGKAMSIQIGNNENHNTCKVQINTHSMELASDVVQDLLAGFLKIKELESKACFPAEMERLNNEILHKIAESNQLKTHFAANISESIQNLKVSVVKAEASLLINDIETMRKNYAQVQQENGTLIGEYIKRTNNHQDLVSTLKELNGMIRNASNLRIGLAQKRVVAEARDAIRK